MRHGSLFSGIGGFDLAAQWMGWENIFHCEKNAFGQQTLKYYWPDATSHDDITTTDFTIYRGSIDILTGGFPCQPYSLAGNRKGKEDSRHLWPEMLRAIREIKPKWIVGENVLGFISWSGGMVFEQVQNELEAEGYEVFSFLLPAAGVNAPHRRYRIWIVAYSNGFDRHLPNQSGQSEEKIYPNRVSPQGVATNTTSSGRIQSNKRSWKFYTSQHVPDWRGFPTQSPVCGRDDGLSSWLVGITVARHRRQSIESYGNAVVPQEVLQIFKSIEAYDHYYKIH